MSGFVGLLQEKAFITRITNPLQKDYMHITKVVRHDHKMANHWKKLHPKKRGKPG